jgi:hypothetical protein
MSVTYREKKTVEMDNKAGGHTRILVYVDGKFSGKIQLLFPQHNVPRWRYLPGGHKRNAGPMFPTLTECKASLDSQ